MNTEKRILTLPIRLAVVVLIFGALFKIMHWPYAHDLMLISSITIAILYTLRFLFKKKKTTVTYVKLVLILLWIFKYFVDAFHLIKLPYILDVVILILFFWWLISDGLDFFKNRTFKVKGITKYLYILFSILCVLALALDIIIKIQHWPYGDLIFVIGILMLNFLIIADYFIVNGPYKKQKPLNQ